MAATFHFEGCPMPVSSRRIAALSLCLALLTTEAQALEYPIGTPQNLAGMEIAAVYLQPVEMEPDGHMRKAAESDVHLEADIHAVSYTHLTLPTNREV